MCAVTMRTMENVKIKQNKTFLNVIYRNMKNVLYITDIEITDLITLQLYN